MDHNHEHSPLNHEIKLKTKQRSLHRLKIIEGHLKSIERMVEKDTYCVDIIHQSMAVQKALKRLDMEIMSSHLQTCVVDQIKHNEVDKSVSELMRLYEMK